MKKKAPILDRCVEMTKWDPALKALFDNLMFDSYTSAMLNDVLYEKRSDGEQIAAMYKTVSDLMEATMHANLGSKNIPGFTVVEEEAADVVIKVLDWAGKRKLKLSEAILAKNLYNKQRPTK